MRSFSPLPTSGLLPLSLLFTIFALANGALAADSNSTAPVDTTDPKNDPRNPLKYITNNTLTTIGLVLMIIVGGLHMWLVVKTKAKYMFVLLIAELCYATGIASRYALHSNPDSSNTFIFEYLFITLAPCGFIAAEYMLLGRLVAWLKADKYLLIRPSRVTKVFVISDVVTFLIQALGGSITVSAKTDFKKAQLGTHIVLLGLVLQLISFIFFFFMLIHFLVRIHSSERKIWTRDSGVLPMLQDWRAFAFAMFLSCVGVLVRSTYRTIELSQGPQGNLTTTEIYFWVLDFVPLYIAIGIYAIFWPANFYSRTYENTAYPLQSQVTLAKQPYGESTQYLASYNDPRAGA
ncbi:RTA1-domain-containing protein [Trametopsis cervina]|nr:RTA1-domain-containing protein [Trametopsis cervina]